jgi:hypothetical protein
LFKRYTVGTFGVLPVKVRTKTGKEVTATESIKLARGEAVHTPESTDSD